MRPQYETERNRAFETAALAKLAQLWGYRIVQTPTTSPIDGLMYKNGRLRGLIEYKRREMRMGQFPNVILSVRKWDFLKREAEQRRIFGIYVVETEGGELWAVSTKGFTPLVVRDSGRTTQTRDAGDIEDCVAIDVSKFVRCDRGKA